MIKFGFFYLNGRFTVYDLTVEQRQGRTLYVATLSEDTRICFAAVRPENAISMLREHLEQATVQVAAPRVTWLPDPSLERRAV